MRRRCPTALPAAERRRFATRGLAVALARADWVRGGKDTAPVVGQRLLTTEPHTRVALSLAPPLKNTTREGARFGHGALLNHTQPGSPCPPGTPSAPAKATVRSRVAKRRRSATGSTVIQLRVMAESSARPRVARCDWGESRPLRSCGRAVPGCRAGLALRGRRICAAR